MLYDVEPDVAMFGKALGNGYAVTAVLVKRGNASSRKIFYK